MNTILGQYNIKVYGRTGQEVGNQLPRFYNGEGFALKFCEGFQ